ncbi:MAG: PLP-dependent transferase [Actinobacteria bacterium]|nr:PLP-dependent transferase [Actinomycetota bacterium]
MYARINNPTQDAVEQRIAALEGGIGIRSLVNYPASTTHSQLNEEQLLHAGISPGFVRLSFGVENVKDISADLELGFAAAKL